MFRCQKRNSDRDWGTVLLVTFCFIVWRSPLSLIHVQESINVLRKYAVQNTVPVVENHSNGFPDNIQLFRVKICAFESHDSRLSASTHCRPGSVQRSVPGGMMCKFSVFGLPINIRHLNRCYGWMTTIFS